MTSDSISLFGLTLEQTCVLFSLQKIIIENDIKAEECKCLDGLINSNEKVNNWITKMRGKQTNFLSTREEVIQQHQALIESKKQWLQEWSAGINDYLRNLDSGKYTGLLNSQLDIIDAITYCESSSSDDIWKYLIMLECCLFEPYYPLNEQSAKDNEEVLDKCHILNNEETLIRICEILRINKIFATKLKKDFKKSVDVLSGRKQRIIKYSLIGMAATLTGIILFQPYLIFAAAGTAGAAAFTSALAALGGGAIAAGGFGMVGGIVVLVGGGSLIGVLAGHGAGAYLSKLSVNAMLRETAKMNVILEDVILEVKKNVGALQNILIEVSKREQELREEIIRLQIEKEKNKKIIKELDKKIDILEQLLHTSRGYSYR